MWREIELPYKYMNFEKTAILETIGNAYRFIEIGMDDWQLAISNKPEDYLDPEPIDSTIALRAAMQMTFAQMLIGLVAMGWITKAEGIAWLGGTVPLVVNTLITSLPADQQFAALARAVRPSVVQRLDSLVIALAAIQGRTEAQMDAFFVTYAAV